MAVATFVDATDGVLARRARVKEVVPHFDGARLDDIVDYLNYVLVPVVLARAAHLLPAGPAGLAVAALPLLASCYAFCQADAKTADHFFKGFPSYWNIVVLYLCVLRGPLWFNTAIVVLLSVLAFVPIRFLYPSRSPIAQRRMYVLGTIWALMTVALILQFPHPSRTLGVISLFFPAYYWYLSLRVHFTHPPSPPPGG